MPHELLGRHVRGRAQDGTGLREIGRLQPCNAKICHFDAAICQHDEVGGLHVSVGHALAVRVVERVQHLHHQPLHLLQGEALVGFKVIPQFTPLHIFHRDEGHALASTQGRLSACDHGVICFGDDFAVVIHRDDALVIQAPGGLGLALESGQYVVNLAALELRRQDGLDGDHALDDGVIPLINNAHGTFSELAAKLVFAQLSDRWHGGSCFGCLKDGVL